MPAVLERGKQVEAALERVAVARPERPLELRVARHTPSCPLLAQEDRLKGLADVATVISHRTQPRNHGREELVQAVRRDVAHRATEEVALRGPQHGDEVVMREGVADIVLEEGHEQRVHDGDVKLLNASEKNAELLILTGTSRDTRVVPCVATNLLEEVHHLTRLVVAIVHDVPLEQSVHVTRDDAGRRVDDRQPVAQELIEDLVIAVRAERLLDLAPVVSVEILLFVHGKAHEHEVTHEIGRGEVLARRVHRLEDELRIVLALRERDSDDLKALDAERPE